jgi:hypothetical protein
MKLHPDDPKLTAYALGELPRDEAALLEKAIAESGEAQAWLADLEMLSGAMRKEFAADLFERKPLNVMPLPTRNFWSYDRWSPVAVAAVWAIGTIISVVVLSGTPASSSGRARLAKAPADVEVEFENETLAAEVEPVGTVTGQGDRFVSAGDNPIATFPIQVNTGSYLDVRRTIAAGSLPPRGSVRIEEMINYFPYNDPAPEHDQPFAIRAEVAACPWRAEHRLVRIALKAQEIAPLDGRTVILAQDVTGQIEFNPTRVSSYRLVGYDQALSPGIPGEIHARDAVTLLYEVVPCATHFEPGEAAVVRINYKDPARHEVQFIEEPVNDDARDFMSASPDFKFAAAVAEFGMFLRNASVAEPRTLGAIADLANDALGFDRDERRAEFIELIRQTQLLTSG